MAVKVTARDHKQLAVSRLITCYRLVGTRAARLDPLNRQKQESLAIFRPSYYGLTAKDMNQSFDVSQTFFGPKQMRASQLLDNLRKTYCQHLGVEFMHITNFEERNWWKKKLESQKGQYDITNEDKVKILSKLIAAEELEHVLDQRYGAQKRFSIEGCESFIVGLQQAIETASSYGVREIVLGMAHRGRLNVLVNIMGKKPHDIFDEFEGAILDETLPEGDLKYHLGFSADVKCPKGNVHLSLEFNPSHLEIVGPVVLGSARARMLHRQDATGDQVMAITIHGDAAIAGQGVVMEMLNMAKTKGFSTGGTIRFVINNQIGFTTSDVRDARSTTYCTDVAKMIEAPILHVNGDDPEAVFYASRLAIEYRMQFKKDVFIDVIGYRRLGHNELDTPSVTQPMMYLAIEKHKTTRVLYQNQLISQNIITRENAKKIAQEYLSGLDTKPSMVNLAKTKLSLTERAWNKLATQSDIKIKSGVTKERLQAISRDITRIPKQFTVHPLVLDILKERGQMGRGELLVNWGMAEHLAFATLLQDGYNVRLSGEDSCRGTFAHRHAHIRDQKREKWDNGLYVPLEHVKKAKGKFIAIDSLLSEEAVLAFEYGYSITSPYTLTIWEAEFGDFANTAQVVIDQFIASGEVKWGKQSGLVMYLPHGFEGQGPEHSSARLERFLHLCANNNIRVIQPTKAAQLFHVLREQMLSHVRRPLIVMTQKANLRSMKLSSALRELVNGQFYPVLDDTRRLIKPDLIKRVLICSGRIYFDLLEYQQKIKNKTVAIIRLEQLYPLPESQLKEALRRYSRAKEVFWVQEEPKNQGAWEYITLAIEKLLRRGQFLGVLSRPESASTAAGFMRKHEKFKDLIIENAFNDQLL